MKILLFPTFTLTLAFLAQHPEVAIDRMPNYADTGHIIHVVDGQVGEWPAVRFHPEEDSTIEYAADNDDKNLYIAMTIPDFGTQVKIMRNGMKLFIDLKGKKKEGRGIEFPIKGEVTAGLTSNEGAAGTQPQEKIDRKTQRNILSLSIVALKLFGFPGAGDEQGLVMPGSVNIAFRWDESDAMHIEYGIPLNLLEESSSLNKKDISLGWKINGTDRPPGEHSFETAGNNSGGFSAGGHGGGRGRYGGRGGGEHSAGNYRKINPDEIRKEQNFWTRYTINI